MLQPEIREWATQVAKLARGESAAHQLPQLLTQPATWHPAAVQILLEQVVPAAAEFSAEPRRKWVWQRIFLAVTDWFRGVERAARWPVDWSTSVRESAVQLYAALRSAPDLQWHVLGWLAALGTGEASESWRECLLGAPPENVAGLPLGFAPWFRPGAQPAELFPAALAALQDRHLAAAILDLANYTARRHPDQPHPARDRAPHLQELLGGVVQQLQTLAEQSSPQAARDPQQREQVSESIALIVALCDTLALIGDERALGKLYQALELPHRRVQTEAAAAMVRLGDQHGVAVLQRLAHDPGARLRVLTYAEELGVLNEIDANLRTPEARAAGELASWLAEPGRFGAPPTALERVDSRKLRWPGFVEPQTCFLFRFVYQLPGGDLQNIGMAGPCTHALRIDATDFAPEDLYAIFAGLQASHPDLREQRVGEAEFATSPRFRSALQTLIALGYQQVELQWLGQILDSEYLIWSAQRNEEPGTAVSRDQEVVWIPEVPAGFTADLAYALFKGKKILGALATE